MLTMPRAWARDACRGWPSNWRQRVIVQPILPLILIANESNTSFYMHIDFWVHWPLCLPVYYAHSQVSFKWNGETCPLSAQCAWNTIPALGILCPADHTMHIGHRPHWARHRLPWSWESYESRESPELQNVKFSIYVGIIDYICFSCRSIDACPMRGNIFCEQNDL